MSSDEGEPLLCDDLESSRNVITVDCVIELEHAGQSGGDGAVVSKDVSDINNIQKLLIETKKNRNLNSNVPLPEGKDAHFFISYSNDDRSLVLPIIAELEQTHGVACIFDERDFLSGMEIHENIKRSMERSMKVLLFLSDNFLLSGFCKYENNLAFVMSLRVGRNIIIPVKLGECEVPSTLETLTYIEGDTDNLAERIVEAYNNTETDFLPDDIGPAKTLENGYSIILPCEPESRCCIRPSNTNVLLTEETRQMLNTGKFRVSEKTVQDAADIANSYRSTGRWSRSKGPVCCCLWLCTWPLIYLTIALIYVIIFIAVSDDRFSQTLMNVHESSIVVQIFGVAGGIVITGVGILAYYSCRRKMDERRLIGELFERITLKTYRDGVYFKVPGRPLDATFLARKIKQFVEENYGGTHAYSMEVYEDRADVYIRNMLNLYIYTSVPDAPFNRHNVKGGRSCLCQFLEPYVGKHVQSWLSYSSANTIEEV